MWILFWEHCYPPVLVFTPQSVPFGVVCSVWVTWILIVVFPLLVFCYLSSLPFEPIFPLFTHSITYSFQSVCQDTCHVQGDTQVQWENILLLLCISHILDLFVFLLGGVKFLEFGPCVTYLCTHLLASLPDLADTQSACGGIVSISSLLFWDLMIEGHIAIFKYSKSIVIYVLRTHSTSFSKLGPKVINNYLWHLWVIWGNQVGTLSSRPECLSQNWFSDLELAFVHFFPVVSQERSSPFELGSDSFCVKERCLLVLLLQTHIELGQVFFWVILGKEEPFVWFRSQ